MSSLNKPQPTLEESINILRDNILRTQSQSNTTSITGFDNLVEQLKVFGGQINAQSTEIKRLQEVCKKNKINYSIPPSIPMKLPESKITPPVIAKKSSK